MSNNGGSAKKMILVASLALVAVVSISQTARRYADPDGARATARAAYAPLIASAPFSPRPADGESRPTLPIYLLSPSANRTGRMPWGELAGRWNRTARYEDILSRAAPAPSLPRARRRRPVVVLHCGPKTGSTTLRWACRKNLNATCGVPAGRSGFPAGYKDGGELWPLVRGCGATSHFCVHSQVRMPAGLPAFEGVVFLHMFPFRNYDEWARSAMKQQYDRGKEKACAKAKSDLERCQPSRMEIDFRKYSKTFLSEFKVEVVQRMNERENEHHIFLLYHHRELNDVLKKLSHEYSIPLLPGSDGKGKDKRPEGTCDAELLEMYHDCFSSKLMELT